MTAMTALTRTSDHYDRPVGTGTASRDRPTVLERNRYRDLEHAPRSSEGA